MMKNKAEQLDLSALYLAKMLSNAIIVTDVYQKQLGGWIHEAVRETNDDLLLDRLVMADIEISAAVTHLRYAIKALEDEQ
jgi:hypothetical protein